MLHGHVCQLAAGPAAFAGFSLQPFVTSWFFYRPRLRSLQLSLSLSMSLLSFPCCLKLFSVCRYLPRIDQPLLSDPAFPPLTKYDCFWRTGRSAHGSMVRAWFSNVLTNLRRVEHVSRVSSRSSRQQQQEP